MHYVIDLIGGDDIIIASSQLSDDDDKQCDEKPDMIIDIPQPSLVIVE